MSFARSLSASILATALAAGAPIGAAIAQDGGRVSTPDAGSIDPGRFSLRPSDMPYGAYQRGYYLTALNLATPLALQGDASAQTLIAEIYSRGLGVPQDLVKAMEWYGKAADQNVPEAQFELAMLLLDGGEEIGDPDRAFDLLKRAADSGNRMAQFNYAQMVVSRQPTRAGMETAVEYFERAALAGLADAQYAMAQAFREGAGGKAVDLAAARRWLQLAARQNYDTAQLELGTWLVEGVGGEPDPEAGFGWLMRAASGGNPAAQNRVAKLYRAGIGVEPDTVEAAAWYLRARQAGLTDTIMEDQLQGLTEEELADARERAKTLR